MGRHFQYNLTPERIEELYQTEMDEEAKNIWASCVEWLRNYTGASKQLIDIRIREWDQEYGHRPMKTVGLTSINRSTKCPEVPGITSNRKHGTKCFRWYRYMIGTTIAVCDQCKLLDECIADILNCRYICLNCHEYNTTKDVNRFYKFRR